MGICDGRVVIVTGSGRGLGRAHRPAAVLGAALADLGLRYDLTVPLARFYGDKLTFAGLGLGGGFEAWAALGLPVEVARPDSFFRPICARWASSSSSR